MYLVWFPLFLHLLLQGWQGCLLLDPGFVKKNARLVLRWLLLCGGMFSLPTQSHWAGNNSTHPSELGQELSGQWTEKGGIFTVLFRDPKWITIFFARGSIVFEYKSSNEVCTWLRRRAACGFLLFVWLIECAFDIYKKLRKSLNISDLFKHGTVEKC